MCEQLRASVVPVLHDRPLREMSEHVVRHGVSGVSGVRKRGRGVPSSAAQRSTTSLVC